MSFHANWIGMFEAIATTANSLNAARFWREDGIFFGITGLQVSVFNGAIIEDNRALTADRLFTLGKPFEALGLPYSIQFCSPEDESPFEAQFTRAGYVEMLRDPLMRRDGPLVNLSLNPHVTITPVRDAVDQHLYTRVFTRSFDIVQTAAQEFIDILLGLPESYHVIGWLEGEAVGIGSLLLCGGAAGVYNVGTVAAARRQGVAQAVMDALHTHALNSGYPGTVLASSAMGYPMYQKLGYQPDGFQYVYVPLGVPV